MNQTDVMVKIVEIARIGGALPANEAVSVIASLVSKLDMLSDSYEQDVELLLKVGATIWDLISGPGGAHDPMYVPPFLRP